MDHIPAIPGGEAEYPPVEVEEGPQEGPEAVTEALGNHSGHRTAL